MSSPPHSVPPRLSRLGVRATVPAAVVSLVLALAFIITGAGVWVWDASSGNPVTLKPFAAHTRTILGQRAETRNRDKLTIQLTAQGRALVVAPMQFIAERYPVVRYRLQKSPRIEARFAWRRAEQPQRIFFVILPHDGHALDLTENPNWVGTIIELGLTLLPADNADAELSPNARQVKASVLLSDSTPWTQALTLFTDWDAFRSWSGRSINHLGNTLLPAILAGWIILAALLALLVARTPKRRVVGLTLFLGVALAWLLLEVLWVHQLMRQSGVTRGQFTAEAFKPRLLQGDDRALVAFSSELAERLRHKQAGGRIFFIDEERYFAERAKYLLLPLEVVHLRDPRLLEPALSHLRSGDAVVAYRDKGEAVRQTLERAGVGYDKLFQNDRRVVFLIGR